MTRSKFESKFGALYPELGYENTKIKYIQPSQERTYNPDWKVKENVFIETKGRLTAADRKKHLLVKEQNPEVTIYFVFENAGNTLTKRSKTTYGMWADKHGFEWHDWARGKNPEIPNHWLNTGDKNKSKSRTRTSRRANSA